MEKKKGNPDSLIERFSSVLVSDQIDLANRTVPCVFYSGATVSRLDWWTGEKYQLKLSTEPAAVKMARINGGAPVLDSHMNYAVVNILGVVDKAWMDGGVGRAILRFSKRSEVEPVWQDVVDRVIQNVSVGLEILKLEDVTPEKQKTKSYLATSWEPQEISAVGIPADPGAGFLSAQLGRISFSGIEIISDGKNTSLAETGAASTQQTLLALLMQRRQWQ